MAVEFQMPKLGLTMEEGTIVEWLVQPGDRVQRGAIVAVVPTVTDADAMSTGRRLAQEEGIFGGISSGANVWVALQRARALGPGKRIVTIICDSGLKYLQGDLYRTPG